MVPVRETVPLFVTRGSGWEAVTGWNGEGEYQTERVKVHRIKAKEDADGTLPLLLSWAHGNLLRAMSGIPEDEGQVCVVLLFWLLVERNNGESSSFCQAAMWLGLRKNSAEL